MNELKDYDFKVNSLKYRGNIIILETDQGKMIYKKNQNNYDIYDYLKSRNFFFIPNIFNSKNTSYELLEYIEDKEVSREQRLNDLIHISSLLHHKTAFYKEIDLNDLKMMYENIQKEADYLMNYYSDLNSYIDSIVFMSPMEYLLVSNLDMFYYLLNFIKVESTNWYNKLKEKKSLRYSMIHNNLKLEHLIEGDKPYLISWKQAKLDMPIFDLKKIFQDNYQYIDFESLLKEYNKEFKLDSLELDFLLIQLSIPQRIQITNDTYQDCNKLSNYLIYLKKIVLLIQKSKEKQPII